MTPTVSLPLHRLLDRREAGALLREFEALTPGADLALIGLDGRLMAERGEWPRLELRAALAQIGDDPDVACAGCHIHALRVRSQLAGGLVTRGPVPEAARRSVCLALTLLMTQAADMRDVARETLERYREINLLYHLSETIGACLNPDDIPPLELAEASHVIQSDASAVLLIADGASDLDVKASLGAADRVEALLSASTPLIDQVRRTGQPDMAAAPPFGAVLCAPLKTQERLLGVVLLGRLPGRPMFTAGGEKLAMALTGQAAIALEKAWLHQQEIRTQRLEEELAIARRIQMSLLPERCPSIPGWEFAAAYQAARQIGGDFYDFLDLGAHRLGLVIADVTDKGIPAALMMAFSRAMIRSVSLSGRSPRAVLEQANHLILQDSQRSQLLLTAFYATLDTHSGQLTYASAGHDWPLWLHAASGQCSDLPARGIILGAIEGITLEERTIDVAPGDVLLFYTDGATDARNAGGEMFDHARLQATLEAGVQAGAEQVVDAMVGAIQSFTGDEPQADDLTLFVVKRQAAHSHR